VLDHLCAEPRHAHLLPDASASSHSATI
jgi:hypothetical protein